MTDTEIQAFRAAIAADWKELMLSEPDEASVQRFLEDNPMLLPGAHEYSKAGNHPPFLGGVFRQARLEGLGIDRYPDFLWLSKSTVFIAPVCIEIERPDKRWFNNDGTMTADFTQAFNQLKQWKTWFSKPVNVTLFRQRYLGDLDSRFRHLKIEPHFVLIYGRQSEFEDPSTGLPLVDRTEMRASWSGDDTTLLTYDSLRWSDRLESALTLNLKQSGDIEVVSIPASYSGALFATAPAMLGSIDSALHRAPHMSSTRADVIRSHWANELDAAKRLRANLPHRASSLLP